MAIDQSNPSEKYGPLASQMFVTAVVVDDKDPSQRGRIKCRILGEQDDVAKIPDDKLPWYQCITNNESQVGGVGRFPNGNYGVGSKVIMINMGQQGFFPIGSMPNNETSKEKQDADMESTSQTKKDKTIAKKEKSFGGKWHGDLEGTIQALMMLNNRMPYINVPNKNPKNLIHNMSGVPIYFGSRSGIKVQDGMFPFSFGSFPLNMADVSNPQKYIGTVLGKPGEMIPNSLSILESLKHTASSGMQVPSIASIGGMGNFLGAIMGILNMFKSAGSKEKSQKELTLYEIYKQETGLDALDKDKHETPEYTKWLEEYLIRTGQKQPQTLTS